MCLLCNEIFSNEVMKLSRHFQHLAKIHFDRAEKDAAFFQSLQRQFQKMKNGWYHVFKLIPKSDNGLLASYDLSFIIARKSKSCTVGKEIILPSVEEVLDTVLHHKTSSAVIQSIPLSNNMVQKWIDEMGANIEDRLCSIIRNTELVSN